MTTQAQTPKIETSNSITKIDPKFIAPRTAMLSALAPVTAVTPPKDKKMMITANAAPQTINVSAGPINFGSGLTDASYTLKMSMNSKGACTFSGTYTNKGSGIFDIHFPQVFRVAIALRSNNGIAYTFAYTGVANPGQEVTWNATANCAEVVSDWSQINEAYWWQCEGCNNLNLSAELTATQDCVNDLKKVGAISNTYTVINETQAPPRTSITYNWSDHGFGSESTKANYLGSVTLNSDGSWKYSGTYQNSGDIPFFTAPNQSFQVAAVVTASNGVVFTFSFSGNVVSTGNNGASGKENWNLSGKNANIANNWLALCYTTASQQLNAQNSTDWGSLFGSIGQWLDGLINDIEDVAQVVEVVSEVVAAVAA